MQMSEPIQMVEEFIAWTMELQGGLFLFRGLPDASWEVESSGYRRIERSGEITSETVPSVTFKNYIDHLLDEAGLRGFRKRRDRSLSDLELLAELQHFGAATCLIDFTTNALVALWFACHKETGVAGKVAAMATDDPERFSSVSYDDSEKPVNEFLKSGKLWKWEPSGLSNRIVAQQSVFVFGEGRIAKDYYEEFTIAAALKDAIIDTLGKAFGISERVLYNDLPGFAENNAHDLPYEKHTPEDFLYQGRDLYQRKEYKPALARFDRAIELHPRYSEAYYSRGNAKSALGDFQLAIEDYNKAIEFYRTSVLFRGYDDAYINRGNAKSSLGDHQGAIEDYNIAISLIPSSSRAYSNRAHCKSAIGDYQGAVDDCEIAIELNPNNVFAFNNRGDAKRELGDHRGAIRDYDRAVDLNPKFAEAFFGRGIAKRASGDEAGARKDFDMAKSLDPDFRPPE